VGEIARMPAFSHTNHVPLNAHFIPAQNAHTNTCDTHTTIHTNLWKQKVEKVGEWLRSNTGQVAGQKFEWATWKGSIRETKGTWAGTRYRGSREGGGGAREGASAKRKGAAGLSGLGFGV